MTHPPATTPYFTPLITPQVTLERDPLRLVSDDFGDIYFSTESGLQESELVFLGGNNVTGRMRDMTGIRDGTGGTFGTGRFTIAETGFGTGLNFLATLRQWRMLGEEIGVDHMPRLHYIATEIAPLEADLIRDVLAGLPEIADDAAMMADILPPRWPGRHRRHICGGRVTLDLLYGDSLAMLARSDFKADAWYLDGFAPAKNPAMWQDDLFRVMAEKSADDATVASFTAAGDVRRGLSDAGFTITRLPGFGRKRHRITGRREAGSGGRADIGAAPSPDEGRVDEEVIIIGAGIAGASVAAGLMRQGITPLVIGRGDGPHDGASGNIAAVQSPRLTAEESFSSQLAMTCYGYARWVARKTEAGLAERAVIYGWNDREQKRQTKILAQGLPQDFVRQGTSDAMAAATGLNAATGGMIFDHGGAVDPRVLTGALLGGAVSGGAKTLYGKTVTAINAITQGWQVRFDDGTDLTARQLVLAGGSGLAALTEDWGLDARQYPRLPFQVTAGRVSHLPPQSMADIMPDSAAMSFGGYMATARDGVIALGATFDKNINDKLDITQQVHEDNIALLPDDLRACLPDSFGQDSDDWTGRVSFRIASKDRHPVAGSLGDGLYILTALGARGMVTGPLLGEYVACLMTDAPSPLDHGMASVVNPMRFRDDGM